MNVSITSAIAAVESVTHTGNCVRVTLTHRVLRTRLCHGPSLSPVGVDILILFILDHVRTA